MHYHHCRKTDDVVRYLDEFDEERRLQEEQQMFEEYKQFRQRVEQWRDQDKNLRNLVKQKQLEQCEELQVSTGDTMLYVLGFQNLFVQIIIYCFG